jgi:hypothetical protein
MSTGVQTTGQSGPSLWREVCDKCGTRMELEGRGYGFERWACPYCRQGVKEADRPVVRAPVVARHAAGLCAASPRTDWVPGVGCGHW